MAKLRSASAYRRIKRAFTRKSKFRKKSFIKGAPGSKVVMFDMGDSSKKYPYEVSLIAKKAVNLRHNAIEAARITANRQLSLALGKRGYAMKIRAVPHHVMRENPLATGAGADRFQSGMKKAFGKPIGVSAHVKSGKILMTAYVPQNGLVAAKEALRKAASKYPIPCSIAIKSIEK